MFASFMFSSCLFEHSICLSIVFVLTWLLNEFWFIFSSVILLVDNRTSNHCQTCHRFSLINCLFSWLVRSQYTYDCTIGFVLLINHRYRCQSRQWEKLSGHEEKTMTRYIQLLWNWPCRILLLLLLLLLLFLSLA
jgi:hypothetical protein